MISSSTQAHFLELYLIDNDNINTSLVSLVPPVTTEVHAGEPKNDDALLLPFMVSGWAADPQAEGVAIAAEMMQQLQEIPGIAGVNLQTSADSTLIQAAIEQSGVRTRAPA